MNKSSIKIAPSILAADFGHIADEAKRVEEAGADYLHIDIMDGSFVPNISIGPQVVSAINKATDMFLDVHLMIYNPYAYVEKFIEAGADQITFHFEATEDVEPTLEYIRKCNVKAGLAFNPETSMTLIPKYLGMCDMILLMTVNPGFGGQSFMPEILEKIRFIRDFCDKTGVREGGRIANSDKEKIDLAPFDIQVDGGINNDTAKLCVEAGANHLVAGSHLFEADDMAKAIEEMKGAVLSS